MTDGLHSFGMAFEHKKNRGDLKKEKVTVKSFSPVWLLVTPWTVAHQAPPSVGSPGKNTGVGCHFLLQGIFPTLASNPGLLHYKQMLYPLSHQGSPRRRKERWISAIWTECIIKCGQQTPFWVFLDYWVKRKPVWWHDCHFKTGESTKFNQ